MRWSGQQVLDDGIGGEAALPGLRGLLRSVRTPEFAGTVFHEVEARSALNRVPGTSPVPFRWTVNPYRGCSHACVYCLAGSTRVLLADGRTRPIADLRVGDAVLGTAPVDRDGDGDGDGEGDGGRRYVPTRVLAHWSTRRPAHRVRLAGGTELVASGEHRFLTAQGWRHVSGGWCRSGRRPRLRTGSALLGPGPFGAARAPTPGYRRGYLSGLVRGDERIGGAPFPSEQLAIEAVARAHHYLAPAAPAHRAVRAPVGAPTGLGAEPGRIPPPVPDRAAAPGTGAPFAEAVRWPAHPGDDWCAGFLAGVLDAGAVPPAGSGPVGPVRIGHHDPDLLGRVVAALGRLGFAPGAGAGRDGVALPAGRDRLRFLQAIDPAVSRAGDLVDEEVTGGAELQVTSVQALGVELPMFDITTGTGDFVAEGVVSHNCFARGSHTYLDLDAGADFDSQIVVKVNVGRVLDRELRRPRWAREPVAMGTNTDPYQRAEGRYRLMPGVIGALARSGTPFSLLTKGTVLARDLPDLTAAAADVPVGLGVSVALVDRDLQARLEPGTPTPAARLELVRRITGAGLACGVMAAPVLPLLTDSAEALDALLERIAAAGASGASVLALHLRPGTREWFLAWLQREHPGLVEPYARLYRRGAYVDPEYRTALAERVAPLLRRHGLDRAVTTLRGPLLSDPAPDGPVDRPATTGEQLSLSLI